VARKPRKETKTMASGEEGCGDPGLTATYTERALWTILKELRQIRAGGYKLTNHEGVNDGKKERNRLH
jgi:hypothetical protein